jgi:hypothetical protein
VKGTALKLWEASRLSFDRPLPGKPPARLSLPSYLEPGFMINKQSQGEGWNAGFETVKEMMEEEVEG